MMYQLTQLKNWNPFKIDALGIVTLLGAEEVGFAFGRLADNHPSSFLPTVGSYVFAANSHTTPIPGFQIYNVTESIYTTDVPGWFSRWLLSRDVKSNATKFNVSYLEKSDRSSALRICIAISLGIVSHAPTMILSVLIWDWWGFANAMLMVLSTLSRYITIQQSKRILDENARTGLGWSGGETEQTTFWILRSGDAVTIRAPKGLLVNCLLTNPAPRGLVHFVSRAVGWLSFGGFAVTLGMATLFIQILVVVIMLSCTCVIVWHVGDDDQAIGTHIRILQEENPQDSDTRAEAYFKLGLSNEQEEDLLRWSLFPQRTNKRWWECYQHCKGKGPTGFQSWREVQAMYAIHNEPENPS
jgi:hypothetical protein